MHTEPVELIAELRRDIDIESTGVEYQRLYEKWLSRDSLALRAQALPLMIGADPDGWRDYLVARDLGRIEASLCEELCTQLRCAENGKVTAGTIRRYAMDQEIKLPLPFERLSDFIDSVLPASTAGIE